MDTVNIQVSGMTCDHCATSAENALNALPGVTASVSLSKNLARVESTGETDHGQLLEAIESQGYGAQLVGGTC